MHPHRWSILIAAALLCTAVSAQRTVVRIEKTETAYQLTRNGKPFFIKGAVGTFNLDRLVAAGGNAVRAGVNNLDEAQRRGLVVLAGLRVGNPRHGFDYNNPQAVTRQLEEARSVVLKYKDHPALLMWSLGNEPEIQTTPQQRAAVWKAVEQMARMVKQSDPNHPVITVIGGQYRQMLHELVEQCPSIDAIGLNSYADMLTLPEDVAKQGWTRAYVVTEFGPRGHWQVAKTPWRVPIEDTSSEKAAFYQKAYEHAVKGQPMCLGSFVFYWSFKQEKTHTWYGMFLPDGSPTESVDVMQHEWTGNWPPNRAPQIADTRIQIRTGAPDAQVTRNPAGAVAAISISTRTLLECSVDARDPNDDKLAYKWDLRLDVADNPNVGGDREEPTPPIVGAIVKAAENRATVQIPATPGKYRLFVYVYDTKGSAATANLSVLAN